MRYDCELTKLKQITVRMKKLYTIYFSVSSNNKSDLIIINSEEKLINKLFKRTSGLFNMIKMSPSKEVINNILQYAKN